MKSRFLLLAIVFTFFLGACSLADDITPPPGYQSPTPAPTLNAALPSASPDLASGAALYAVECAPCHGASGLGDGPLAGQLQNQPPALAQPELARASSPAAWFAVVTEGRMQKFMPPFSNKLNDQQRWEVVAYALSLGATPVEVEAGKAIFEANCVQCHGANGQANPAADLSSPAALARFSLNDLAAVVAQGQGNMPGFKGQFSEPELLTVAAYTRSLAFGSGPVAAAVAQATPAVTPSGEATPSAEATPVIEATPAETLGSISGKVANASGAAIPNGLKAVLHIFEHNAAMQQFNEVETVEAPVGVDGLYIFADLALPADRAFFVSVDYAGITYESDPAIPGQDGLTSYDLPITLYETTSDTTALTVTQAHFILDYSKPNLVQVVEFLIIANPDQKTVAAAKAGEPVVEITLPTGAANLQFEQGVLGERFLQTETGFADTFPVLPGAEAYQLVFAFDLPLPQAGFFGGPTLEFSQPLDFQTAAISVLVPEGVTLKADGFTLGETQEMGQGVKYQIYTANTFQAGSTLKISASGTPKTTSSTGAATPSNTQYLIYLIGGLGLSLILVGGWLFWRDRQRAAQDEAEDLDEAEESDDPAEATDELLDAIVALDDQFKAGKLAESAYQERRAELKAKLKARL